MQTTGRIKFAFYAFFTLMVLYIQNSCLMQYEFKNMTYSDEKQLFACTSIHRDSLLKSACYKNYLFSRLKNTQGLEVLISQRGLSILLPPFINATYISVSYGQYYFQLQNWVRSNGRFYVDGFERPYGIEQKALGHCYFDLNQMNILKVDIREGNSLLFTLRDLRSKPILPTPFQKEQFIDVNLCNSKKKIKQLVLKSASIFVDVYFIDLLTNKQEIVTIQLYPHLNKGTFSGGM